MKKLMFCWCNWLWRVKRVRGGHAEQNEPVREIGPSILQDWCKPSCQKVQLAFAIIELVLLFLPCDSLYKKISLFKTLKGIFMWWLLSVEGLRVLLKTSKSQNGLKSLISQNTKQAEQKLRESTVLRKGCKIKRWALLKFTAGNR